MADDTNVLNQYGTFMVDIDRKSIEFNSNKLDVDKEFWTIYKEDKASKIFKVKSNDKMYMKKE